MSSERRLVSFDCAMIKLLRKKVDFVIFEGFLSELLHDHIKIKNLLESESNRESKNDKTKRVDILVENSREELIIIEVQSDTE
jgi:DNA-binding sugar fermentation-stimulating protein